MINTEANKLMELIEDLQKHLQEEYVYLTDEERVVKEKMIADLRQAWTNAVLYWDKHHHVSR